MSMIGIIIAGVIVVYCVTCRIACLNFRTHNPLIICAYLGMAAWASSRVLQAIFEAQYSLTDFAGVTAVATYLLVDMRRWRQGVPEELYRPTRFWPRWWA